MQPLRIIIAYLIAMSLGFTMTSLASAQTGGNVETGDSMLIEEGITASGPIGPLAGTLTRPNAPAPLPSDVPLFLIVPGSGPTDRDGNSPFGITASPYWLLAEALAERGYPSVRIDKCSMFGSAGAVSDPNAATIAAYGDELVAWTTGTRERLPTEDGTRCIIPIGHSEGGLVTLAAMGRIP